MANNTQNTDFTLSKDSYAAFDATSLKQLIKDRLNDNSTFTGQNFEGSNISSLIDIVAYSYHVLLYYLNQTSTESMFSEAQLYENVNRIVKSLGYNPVGTQSCVLSFESIASSTLATKTYTIPRYTYIDVGGIFYSFKEDVSFSKTNVSGDEQLTDFSESNLLYQGRYVEYPLATSGGDDFETITVTPGDDIIIDSNTIDVYVRDVITNKFVRWEQTSSLFLESSTSKSFEVRYNENRRYEIKFGDGRTGAKLNAGDQIAIYYLESQGQAGKVSAGTLNNSISILYSSIQFLNILDDVKLSNFNFMSQQDLNLLTFNNNNAASDFYAGETVDEIKQRAPITFNSQNRLVTKQDYETFVERSFANVIKDVKVVNNNEYINGHLEYLVETLNLNSSTTDDARSTFNNTKFSSSCNFNDIFVYAVPRVEKTASSIVRTNYLTVSQKSAIIDEIRRRSIVTSETILQDPVYVAVDVGTFDSTIEDINVTQSNDSIIQITKTADTTQSNEKIKSDVYNIIFNYISNTGLGDTLRLSEISTDILNVEGVSNIKTIRTDSNFQVEGLNLFVYNPIYPDEDILNISADLQLPYFKFAYLFDASNFLDKIIVTD